MFLNLFIFLVSLPFITNQCVSLSLGISIEIINYCVAFTWEKVAKMLIPKIFIIKMWNYDSNIIFALFQIFILFLCLVASLQVIIPPLLLIIVDKKRHKNWPSLLPKLNHQPKKNITLIPTWKNKIGLVNNQTNWFLSKKNTRLT